VEERCRDERVARLHGPNGIPKATRRTPPHLRLRVAKAWSRVAEASAVTSSPRNIMKQAANLNFEIGVYLPGTHIKTSRPDFARSSSCR